MSDYSRWYKDGEASVTNGSKVVTGSGTYWKTAGVKAGDMLTLDGGNSFREIATINSDTSITLAANYTGSTASKVNYAIVRSFTSGTVAEVAAQVSDLLSNFKHYMSEDMQKLNGKSAYEVAKDNGYTGTESQWLESLKGGGEITALKNAMTFSPNGKYRNANLGDIASYKSAENICPGCYWKLNDKYTLVVADVNTFAGYDTADTTSYPGNIVCLVKSNTTTAMTADNSVAKGLTGTTAYKETLPAILSDLESLVGAGNILPLPKCFIASACDESTGEVTAWTEKKNEKIFLPTLHQIYGVDSGRSLYLYQSAQFALFRNTNVIMSPITSVYQPWVADLARWTPNEGAYRFAWLHISGRPPLIEGWHADGATNVKHNILPYIILSL